MSDGSMKKVLEDLLSLPGEEWKNKLPAALVDIRKYGLGRLLRENPDFLGRLLDKLRQNDAATVFRDLAGSAERFLDLFWEGVGFLAARSEDVKSELNRVDRHFRVNVEASDSPFQSHFIVEQGKIAGRSGLLPFKDEDFRFLGPTEVLIGLLMGDLPLGFSNLRLQTAGHSGWVSRIAPVIRGIAKLLKPTQEPAGRMGAGI